MFDRTSKCAIAGRPCPRNGNPDNGDFCPWWWTITYSNKETGQTEDVPGCGATHLPRFMQDQTAEVKVASDAVQKTRGETQNMHRQAVAAAALAVQTMHEVAEKVDQSNQETAETVERALLAGGGGLVELAGRRTTPAALGDGGRE